MFEEAGVPYVDVGVKDGEGGIRLLLRLGVPLHASSHLNELPVSSELSDTTS